MLSADSGISLPLSMKKLLLKVHISSYSRDLEFSSIVQSRSPAANIAVKVIHTPEVHIGTNYEYLKEKRNFEEL